MDEIEIQNSQKIKKTDLLKMFFRSFLVQGSWNYRSLLGLGFCFCTFPVLKRLCSSEEEKKQFMDRHLSFFNAHPYFAGYCLGAVAKMEENRQRAHIEDDRIIRLFKERLVGPLGAIGDRLFWSNIKPCAAGIGVWLGLIFGWIAVPVFLVLYNIPHLYFRAKGIYAGYKKGFEVIPYISEKKYKKLLTFIPLVGLFVAGLCAGIIIHLQFKNGLSYILTFISAFAASVWANSQKININYIIILATIIAVLIGSIARYIVTI